MLLCVLNEKPFLAQLNNQSDSSWPPVEKSIIIIIDSNES